MLFSRYTEFAVPALCAFLFLVGAYAAWLEARAFFVTPVSDTDRFSALADHRGVAGLSVFSTRYLLQDCDAALTGAYGRLQPDERRRAVAAACRDIAAAAVAQSRMDGLAHTIGARASAVLGNLEEAARSLLESAGATPHEMWQAQRRLLVMREWALDGDPALAEQFRRDMAVAAATREGRHWLARWYAGQPDRRELIVSVVEGQGEHAKRDFLNAVRAAQ